MTWAATSASISASSEVHLVGVDSLYGEGGFQAAEQGNVPHMGLWLAQSPGCRGIPGLAGPRDVAAGLCQPSLDVHVVIILIRLAL